MSRYAESHIKTAGPGDARPTALQVIKDEGLEGALQDRVFLITGASAGIGIETARAITTTGAKVFLAVRDMKKGQTACESFLEPGRVELLELDTSKLDTVRACAEAFLKKSSKLNVLICNAGIMNSPTREETAEGFEMQLATNYLGHFLLFWLLKDAMLEGAKAAESSSRLVNVSSSGHHASEVIFDDFQLKQDYTAIKAYGQSKLAQIYMANYVDRNFGPKGIHALSLMPGGIMTNLQKHVPEETKEGWKKDPFISNFMKSPEQGAATTIVAAVAKEWEGKGGKYLEDCRVATPEPLIPFAKGVKDYAYDEDKENKLWELTLKTLNLV
ncbi:putative oxidoreductase,short chain dehydrogenase [Xylaria bambusicola]|uniref:putative oxidoreductase,short chain dehydrogenase n=1 Tax=Xylaria bambusicola TaxID=326684 RepID=UPI0020073E6E|nr:putative oxidoreductase,short chain dehydrogenase [Xylaria bambusicola]KAI0516860.1 putative oxidoreductase,short chain dehydrogenase [Xylaria bambusicola]